MVWNRQNTSFTALQALSAGGHQKPLKCNAAKNRNEKLSYIMEGDFIVPQAQRPLAVLLVGRIFVSKIWGTYFQAEERDSINMQVD